jgi:hypothetical protein
MNTFAPSQAFSNAIAAVDLAYRTYQLSSLEVVEDSFNLYLYPALDIWMKSLRSEDKQEAESLVEALLGSESISDMYESVIALRELLNKLTPKYLH